MRSSIISIVCKYKGFSHADLVRVLFKFIACNNNIGLYQV